MTTHPSLQPYAGFLENLQPLFTAYFKGVSRSLRPAPVASEAPADLAFGLPNVTLPRERVAGYLDITDGTDLGVDPEGPLPPVAFTVWFLRPYLQLLSADALGLKLLGMVHLENELEVHRPLYPQDAINSRVSLADYDRTDSRVLLTVLCENRAGAELASVSKSRILVRLGGGGGGGGGKKKRVKPTEPDPTDSRFAPIRTLPLAENLGRRYGLLGGDVNPIHLHRFTSAAFGFRRPILHGFCLKGMVAHALIRQFGAGDLARLERLSISFRRAVPLPGGIVIKATDDAFVVTNADGDRLFADGSFSLND